MGLVGREIGHFFVGLMFLTRLPVPRGLDHYEGRLARAARYFPLIGVLIGVLTGCVFLIARNYLPAGLAAGLTLTVGVILTGALHEDGLADTFDGIGGASGEGALEIMRDSRLGTYGAVALVFSLGLRWFALMQFEPIEGLVGLIVCHSVSRSAITPVLVSGHYARSRGLATSVAGGVTGAEAAFALVTAVLIALIAGPVAGMVSVAAALLAGGVMLIVVIRKIGGYTGDSLGAIQQAAEIASLVALAGIWS